MFGYKFLVFLIINYNQINCICFKEESFQRSSTNFKVCTIANCQKIQLNNSCVNENSVSSDTTYLELISLDPIENLYQGAIQNLKKLTVIKADNASIQNLHESCFLNLIKLEKIILSYNQIEEVRKNVFTAKNLVVIDLSYNKIKEIKLEVFSNLGKLENLNLKQNNLQIIQKKWFRNLLKFKILDLSENKIHTIENGSFLALKTMRFLYLQNNKLKKISLSILERLTTLTELNLSNNLLENIDGNLNQVIFTVIDNFKIGGNNLTFLSRNALKKIQLKRVEIYPNPWQCSCLQKLWKWIEEKKIEVVSGIYHEGAKPICVFPLKNSSICTELIDENHHNALSLFVF